ncbi:nucleoside deaminase [Pedobacter antarcticus]|uniref:tRNA-specific adenosine deaminase n=2 Tax=Pedobacter antarcticus TaxID=34086 RepID=A0A081PGG8_9SPHI|nr:nucleoside deaminase [Pedobacter antarcticus]KEQ29791.1 CMP deaminase [Pedobacter antarcticus 4BY]SDM49826.1 tRNA(adenine34) deaminase [Pedobacter antarcticus]SFE68331.1 tRNA(adenine34) deaminase [Pedobacter antarcticus]
MSFYDFTGSQDPQQEDEHYMRLALQEAEQAYTQDEIPIGAIVVSKGRIVGRGHNLTEQLNDVTAHAEMQAFTAAGQTIGGKYLKDCTLYVTVEPCVMCAGAAYWMQIGAIVYGASEPKRGYSSHNSNLLHPKTVIRKGVLAEQCAALMKRFFATKRS